MGACAHLQFVYIVGMTLNEFIDQRGVTECAELFGVAKVTVYSWRSGLRAPSRRKSVAIELATGGAVTLREVLDHPVRGEGAAA